MIFISFFTGVFGLLFWIFEPPGLQETHMNSVLLVGSSFCLDVMSFYQDWLTSDSHEVSAQ